MKKRISILVLMLSLLLSGLNVQAMEKRSTLNFDKYAELILGNSKGSIKDENVTSLIELVEELVSDIKPEDAEKILDFVKEKLEEGNWDSKEGLKKAMEEGEDQFGVSLTKEQKELIASLVSKIKKLGIDPKFLVEQAEKIYEKYSQELKEEASVASQKIAEEVQENVKKEIKNSITGYFTDMVDTVKTFFKGIFKK